MRVSSITVIMAVAALVSGPGLATGGIPAATTNPPGADDFFVHASRVSCVDRSTDLRLTSLARTAITRSTRCGNLASTGRSPCISPAAGLPLALLDTAATNDDKTRLANLKIRRAYLNAYLKAHGVGPANLASHVGQAACIRPAAGVSNPASSLSLSASARAGVAAATAGSNSFLGLGAVFAVLGATAGTVGGVAALASSGTTPASP